jgi:hypothetical protein
MCSKCFVYVSKARLRLPKVELTQKPQSAVFQDLDTQNAHLGMLGSAGPEGATSASMDYRLLSAQIS